MSIIAITDGDPLRCVTLNSSGVLKDLGSAGYDKPASARLDADALLLDTPADTIGIRPVPGHRRWLSRWRTQRAIIAQARRLDSAAEIDLLSLPDDQQAIVVLNRQVPAEWPNRVSGSTGVRYRQVLSATRAVARYGPQGDVCCLYVVRRGQRVRHLLCRDRVACFTREVVCESVDSALAALDETLEYLSARDLLAEHTLLAYGALLAGEQAHLVKHPAFADQWLLTSEAADSAIQDVFLATAVRALASVSSARSGHWRIGSRDRGLSPLDPWHADRRACRRLRRYRCGVGGAGMLVILTGGVTVLQASSVWQRWEQQQAETDRLSSAVAELQRAARELHPQPAQAATLLEARHRLSAGTRAGSLWIPALLGSVLSRFEAITLQQLSWQPGSPAVASDDATDRAPWQVNARDSVPMADSAPTHWQVLVSGQLDFRLSLRERQSQFEAFVETLRQQPEVRRVNIGLSPVEAWRFSSSAVSSSGLFAGADAIGATGDGALPPERDRVADNGLVFELSIQIVASDHG